MSAERPRDGMLGALRSELDDSDTGLHQVFETLASLAGTVRSAYMAYRITPEKAGELFKELRLNGSDGGEWTVGASTGQWFRRRGGARWEKAGMPLGVTPSPGALPDWVEQGIAAKLSAAEKSLQETARSMQEAEPVRDAFAEGSINPFQRKSGGEDIAGEAGNPRSSAVSGDIDWIYEEWENSPVIARKTTADSPVLPQRSALPKDLPADLDPDRALEKALLEESGPVDRAGADHAGGAPEPRKINPEEYFLPPE